MTQRGETVTYNDKTYTYVQSRITYNGNNVTYAGSKTLPTAGRVMSTDMTIEPLAQLEEITLTSNQTIAYSGDGDGWNKITVAVPSDIRNQSKEVNPSLSDNTVTPDAGYSGLSSVKVNKLLVEGLDATKIISGQTVSIGFTGSPSGITVVTGSYASDASATPGDLLYNKTAYTEDGKITGTIESKTSANVSANGPTVNIPIGYYPSGAQYTVDSTTHNLPEISVNTETGMITARHSVTAGWLNSETVINTLSQSTVGATVITPSTTTQTAVAANKYTLGAITVGPIPSEYIIPTGTITINAAGTTDVGNFKYAQVASATIGSPIASSTVSDPTGYTGEEPSLPGDTIPYEFDYAQFTFTATPSYTQSTVGYVSDTTTHSGTATQELLHIPVYHVFNDLSDQVL